MFCLSEAVKAILDYTTSPVELMRRRKMKRDVLFQYLVDCNVVVSVSTDKKDLIQRILKHWGAPAVDLSEVGSAPDKVVGCCCCCCFTSTVNSYGHMGTVSKPNYRISSVIRRRIFLPKQSQRSRSVF